MGPTQRGARHHPPGRGPSLRRVNRRHRRPSDSQFLPSPSLSPARHTHTQLWTHQVQGLRKEFFTQISYLFQIMRKVENRGFMFRLDFNGYLSTLANEISSGM